MVSSSSDCQVRLPDGRRLAYRELGRANGAPLIYCHGWPGSRLEALFFAETAQEQGVRLVSIDRPGMGLSDFQSGRRISDWPQDVEHLLQHLHIQKFTVVGISGGAPYAIACAASFPERTRSLGIVAGVAPLEPGLMVQLAWWNRWMVRLTQRSRPAAHLVFASMTRLLLKFPSLFLGIARLLLRRPDRDVLSDSRVTSLFPMLVREPFRNGIEGPELDGLLYRKPWEISPGAIQAPVFLWHGDADRFIPAAMSRRLAKGIPGAHLTVVPGEGHLSLPFRCFPTILQTLLKGGNR